MGLARAAAAAAFARARLESRASVAGARERDRGARADGLDAGGAESWESALEHWAGGRLAAGQHGILDEALPRFEQIMIETALRYSGGRRQDAAKLLGWGRNTLTRKIKEHGMYEHAEAS